MMTPEVAAHHNRLYERALSIAKEKVLLEEKPTVTSFGPLKRLKLTYAAYLFKRAIKLNPENWHAMWFTGKIYQGLQNNDEAYSWFERAYAINQMQPDILREYSICAMEVGRSETAIDIARAAVRLKPDDSGLQANLALAYLLGNRIADSQAAIDQALIMNRSDKIALDLSEMIKRFARGGVVPPNATSRLLSEYPRLATRSD
jgi:tetratricopeptide (TPR) repeat protein